MRAAIYCRISLDRVGAGLGVERQEKECREYCERRGWDVGEVYVDNDVTASKKGKVRPSYVRMWQDVRDGKIDAVVSWHIDRLTRQPRELEDVIDLAGTHKVQLGTVTGDVDLATPTGQLAARIVGNAAAYESAHKADRARSWSRQRAESGAPHTGGPRPYGYLSDRVSLDPSEAPFIAEAAKRVLAGESLRSVARDLTERGAVTVSGRPWSAPRLKHILGSARISGRREVGSREPARGGMGTIVAVDCWEAIITPDESDRLRALFANPGRRSHSRSTRGTHLLTGVLRCGRCQGRMTALVWKRGDKELYRCPSPGGSYSHGTCGRLSVLMKHAEPVVRNLVLEALDSPDFYERLYARAEVDPAVAASIAKDEQQLDELAALMAEGDLTMSEWKTARDIVQARLAHNKATLARVANVSAIALMDGEGELIDRWDALLPAQKRAVIGEVMESVDVKPCETPGGVFDPKRLVPTYRF